MFNPIKKYKKQKEEKHKITQKDRFNSALSNFEVNQIVNGDFEGFMTQFRDHSLIMLIVGRRGAGKIHFLRQGPDHETGRRGGSLYLA